MQIFCKGFSLFRRLLPPINKLPIFIKKDLSCLPRQLILNIGLLLLKLYLVLGNKAHKLSLLPDRKCWSLDAGLI